ncbi:MAG: NAD(P)H-dependent glycerol-3-phosphate dehydrogenase [Paracoccaceae bacterium]|nr:NAD(P)H-dependent glycerol-3-phosphate dehydrogenase [Paracoccaceae bacterium]
MSIAVLGAGAFGTALAVSLARKGVVTLWARSPDLAREVQQSRQAPKLPNVTLPKDVRVTGALAEALTADILLLAVPTQSLAQLLQGIEAPLAGKTLVACCKGIDLRTGTGPTRLIGTAKPQATAAMLTGPSFAADIARGLPTALTLACADATRAEALQETLSTETLRLYRTTDVAGAELGGAVKNVIAIACGAVIGAGLGDSARAALMTRGFAEMRRLAPHFGADPETLTGLSGIGDLALTCTSKLSRNYRYGQAIGRGDDFDPTITVEGAATARAVAQIAQETGLSLPVSRTVAALTENKLTVAEAMRQLLSRPLKEE